MDNLKEIGGYFLVIGGIAALALFFSHLKKESQTAPEGSSNWPTTEATIEKVKFVDIPNSGKYTNINVYVFVHITFSYTVDEKRYDTTRVHTTNIKVETPDLPNIEEGDIFSVSYDPKDPSNIFYLDQFPRLQ